MKREKRTLIIIFIFLLFLLFIINYSFLDHLVENSLVDRQTFTVERIVDGDTIIANGESIRLLGINSPEKGEKYSEEATQYLSNLIFNKTVEIEFGPEQRDKYGRILAYIYVDGFLVNSQIVREGYANIYFPSGKDNYYNSFLEMWRKCLEDNQNLCERSQESSTNCIVVKEISSLTQKIIFHNRCLKDIDLTAYTLKDEGRKKFTFPSFNVKKESYFSVIIGNGNSSQENQILYWPGEDYVLTSTGDSIFLRDGQDRLVLWNSY